MKATSSNSVPIQCVTDEQTTTLLASMKVFLKSSGYKLYKPIIVEAGTINSWADLLNNSTSEVVFGQQLEKTDLEKFVEEFVAAGQAQK